MTVDEQLHELHAQEIHRTRLIKATTLAFCTFLCVLVGVISIGMPQTYDAISDDSGVFLAVGVVVIVMTLLAGFGYGAYLRHSFHRQRLALVGKVSDKRKNDKRKNSLYQHLKDIQNMD
jgi:hypothetical protein